MSERPPIRICLVEDDPIVGESLCQRFELEGFAFDWYRTAAEALAGITPGRYTVVISDIRLPDLGGDEVFEQLAGRYANLPPFIFITGYGSIERAVRVMKHGAADYITKPFDLAQLIEKVEDLGRAAEPRIAADAASLGISPAMRHIEEMLPRLALHADTILITGESGVGKERIAQRLHELASRGARQPFVAVNCGAVTESLLEAELFGHEKGAFTGAVRAKKGYFEQADGGTLFLDEIGEMPPPMQVKLLRAIQERRIVRVGGEQPIEVRLRLICATNRELRDLVVKGAFREDLYYRVNVVRIRVPPLRERREDIPWLAQRFLDEFAGTQRIGRRALSAAAQQALFDYPWPGNIRELRHCLERGCIVYNDRLLEPPMLFESEQPAASPPDDPRRLSDYLHECERAYITRTLEANDWHIGDTAERLGISRKNLWEKMKKLGVREREG
jgi:DNA-binding NtrC family response regulator